MSQNYLRYFGFRKEPFVADIEIDELLRTAATTEVGNRVEYAIRLGSVGLITGDVGCGKSTALRLATAGLLQSQYKVLRITASSGSILEFYRKVLDELDLEVRSFSKAVIVRAIKKEIRELVLDKRRQPVVVVDEANLLRLDVFAELHTLMQFESDSKPTVGVLQNNIRR